MHYSRRLVLAAGLTCCLTLPAMAVEPYVTARMLDLTVLLPPPPAAGSPADAADLQAVLDAQAHASEARRALALADTDETIYAMFGSVLGADFTAEKLPKTSLLFARLGASEDAVVDVAKPVFGRLRPWIGHPEVKANAKPSKSPSYPSGHTTRVAASAIVLSQILPERKRDIWSRADEYAQSRIIAGMHYPTDLAAGWSSGTALAVMLVQQPDFKTDFAAARTELRAAMGLPAE